MFISNMTLPLYDCMVSSTLIVTVVGAEIGFSIRAEAVHLMPPEPGGPEYEQSAID